MKIALIAIGGAIGSILRYLLSNATYQYLRYPVFPWGTLVVNGVGSLAIGFLWGISEANLVTGSQRVFLFIGLLGGFTTFSSFSIETMHLIRLGETAYAISNIVLSNVLGITLAFVGFFSARFLIDVLK